MTTALMITEHEIVAGHIREILKTIGVNLEDPSVIGTPDRVAKMFLNEIFYGLRTAPPKMTTQPNLGYDQMLVEVNIKVNSTCEHHMVPIIGVAHVAYIPNLKLLGLSKFNRAVDYFARRPQVQERLTEQILDFLKEVLETDDVAVVIDAAHFCVRMRGIQDHSTVTRTCSLGGKFRSQEEVRQELMAALPKPGELRLC